jgi:hypothetical protein
MPVRLQAMICTVLKPFVDHRLLACRSFYNIFLESSIQLVLYTLLLLHCAPSTYKIATLAGTRKNQARACSKFDRPFCTQRQPRHQCMNNTKCHPRARVWQLICGGGLTISHHVTAPTTPQASNKQQLNQPGKSRAAGKRDERRAKESTRPTQRHLLGAQPAPQSINQSINHARSSKV